MIALVKLFKWLIITALALAVLAVAGYFSYLLYSDAQANKALTHQTNSSDWQWQRNKGMGARRFSNVQWLINETGRYVMRRVYDDHQVVAVLAKTEDGAITLISFASWLADCEDGMTIETSVTDIAGEAFTLSCSETDWGSSLGLTVNWSDWELDDLPRWSENFDGFEVDEDFDSYVWDFQPAMRQLTLQSAKTTEEK